MDASGRKTTKQRGGKEGLLYNSNPGNSAIVTFLGW